LAGGVALNCVANGRLLREGPFESIWVQPAAGDAGGALGAALIVWYRLMKNPRVPGGKDSQKGSLLGPAFSPAEIHKFLTARGIRFQAQPESDLVRDVAELLAGGAVVGWFQGRMEYGPRALGNRSILGDPRPPGMQSTINQKIKFRESFRPFAPAVLVEESQTWFDLPRDQESPYMLLVAPVRPERRLNVASDQLDILENHPDLNVRIGVPRSTIPAVTHVDASARIQTVDRERNPRFHGLLRAFESRTGCPILVNTSFNIRGEPIVCTPEEALNCFLGTDLDALVLEDVLLRKVDVAHLSAPDRGSYATRFEAD
jgi:carbamoyltransferase